MKKRSKAGESIAETLVAVLIMALIFLMLSSAVTSAARVNAALKNEEAAFVSDKTAGGEQYDVTVRITDGASVSMEATFYETGNEYHYYVLD